MVVVPTSLVVSGTITVCWLWHEVIRQCSWSEQFTDVVGLSENRTVTGDGLIALGESLKGNRGLKTLSLRGLLNVSDNHWKQFIVCLQENNDLTKLFVPSSSTHEVVRQEAESRSHIRRQNNPPPLEVDRFTKSWEKQAMQQLSYRVWMSSASIQIENNKKLSLNWTTFALFSAPLSPCLNTPLTTFNVFSSFVCTLVPLTPG